MFSLIVLLLHCLDKNFAQIFEDSSMDSEVCPMVLF